MAASSTAGRSAALAATALIALLSWGRALDALGQHAALAEPGALFESSDACLACHNQLTAPSGEDVSIGSAWRATMMANSARDPYWQASLRREVLEHPSAAAAIENECSTCHMPMMQTEARVAGGRGEVFANLPVGAHQTRAATLAADGVSCTVCHQITPDGLGDPSSYNGHFRIDETQPWGERPVYGRHEVDSGRALIMHSSSAFVPAQGLHVRRSELCASCHTLFTTALDSAGQPAGRLPEQVPYLEWRHSRFAATTSCQDCHMPTVTDSMPISGVWGRKRAGLARHDFLGGNFFMLAMLARYGDELGVRATREELERGATRTREHLGRDAASVALRNVAVSGSQLSADVVVTNLTGHKLPTAYPSRRAWLHVVVRDRSDRVVFESGAVQPDGSIRGNDGDANALAFEPHHREVRTAEQVQVYESVMVDPTGAVTTGLLRAVRYVKDNRLLPAGFDKRTASADVAVHGAAATDDDFVAATDVVRYVVNVPAGFDPYTVSVTLRYQPIAFRWAQNLRAHDAPEIARFTRYYEAMAGESSTVLARDSVRTPAR